MEKKYFNVTYRVSEDVWSANLAHAESADDVRAYYERENRVSGGDIIIADADDYAVEDAQRRHKPIVEIDHVEPAAIETAPADIASAVKSPFAVVDAAGVIMPADSETEARELAAGYPGATAYQVEPAAVEEKPNKRRVKRADFLSTFSTCGRCTTVVVTGASMDAVNDYLIKHFDVVPGAEFSVTTVPDTAGIAGLNTIPHMFTTRAPSRKAIDFVVRSCGVHVSEGNMKMGRVASISLAPGKSCSADACRTCLRDGCYACKSYRLYPETRAAWDANTATATGDLQALKYALALYLRHRSPRFFRFHVGGDFISRDYAATVADVAGWFPRVKFLAFTKQFDVVRGVEFPANFTLRLSDWPGLEIPADLAARYHVAWMDDNSRPAETFPADALECPGNCETCGACWNIDRDTIFHKH